MVEAPKPTDKQISAYVVLDDEEKIKRYSQRIEWAEKATSKARNMANIFIEYYRNRPMRYTRGGQQITVPTAIKNVDAMFAALTAFAVTPVVAPKGMTTYDMARVQQQALRNEWDELDVLYTTEFAIKEALVPGIGFVKVGYEFEEVEEEYEVEGETPEGTATETDTDTVIVKDNVYVEHIPFDEIFWDPEARKWDDVTWVAQKHVMTLEELKADERFENTEDITPSAFINERKPVKGASGETNPDAERVIVWEVTDLVRGNVCWFAKDHDKILREAKNPLVLRMTFRKRNPYIPYIHRKDIGGVWGISDVMVMKPSIDEQNVLRSSIATWVERAKPKLIADEGSFTEQGKRALRSQEWGEVVELMQGRVMQQSVKELTIPNLPGETFSLSATAAQDADDAVGMTDLLGAQLPTGRKTATAMQQLGQATTVRQSEKRNQLERFYREIADKMLYLMQAYYEQDRITRLVEDMGDVVWDWNNEDISFESSVAVEVEPKEVLDTEGKREKFLAMLNILSQDPTINQIELKKFVLRDGLGIPAEIVRLLVKDEQTMQEEQQAQFEQEMALKGGGQGPSEGPPSMLESAQTGAPTTAVPTVPQ